MTLNTGGKYYPKQKLSPLNYYVDSLNYYSVICEKNQYTVHLFNLFLSQQLKSLKLFPKVKSRCRILHKILVLIADIIGCNCHWHSENFIFLLLNWHIQNLQQFWQSFKYLKFLFLSSHPCLSPSRILKMGDGITHESSKKVLFHSYRNMCSNISTLFNQKIKTLKEIKD